MAIDSPLLGFVRFQISDTHQAEKDKFLDWLDESLRLVVSSKDKLEKIFGDDLQRKQHRSPFCAYSDNQVSRELISSLSKDLKAEHLPDRKSLEEIVDKGKV